MQAVKTARPYWRYEHNDGVENPRPEHLAWDGLVLKADDPWWNTHYPQNGWGCKCRVVTLNKRDMKKSGKSRADQAPKIEYKTQKVGTSGPSPRTVKVPKGIDPGFAYNPGKAAWGETVSDAIMDEWRASKNKWQPLIQAGWAEAGRPEKIPMTQSSVQPIKKLASKQAVLNYLNQQYGEQNLFKTSGLPVLLNSKTLADHIDVDRSEYLPFLADLLTNPYEVWLNFERHAASGRIALRTYFIKGYQLEKDRYLLTVANARGGYLEGWTFIPTSRKSYIQARRMGRLIYEKQG